MKEPLKNIVNKFSNCKVAVWGDIILDEYILTSTGRVSREAPVLITEYQSSNFKPGGAGNVILNLKTLGAEVFPLGFCGKDPAGSELQKIFESYEIRTDFLVKPENYISPKKSRILSGGDHTKKQQVLRIDTIDHNTIPRNYYSQLEENIAKVFETVDTVIISDYIHKSVLPLFYRKIRKRYPNKVFVLDSRKNFLDFPNIDFATPNEPETRQMFPDRKLETTEDFISVGKELQKKLGTRGLIIKLGHNGMIVFDNNSEPVHIPIHGSDDIVDVTGAGDTVISTLSLCITAGAKLLEGAKLSTIAAGFVVMKAGAYPISQGELINEL